MHFCHCALCRFRSFCNNLNLEKKIAKSQQLLSIYFGLVLGISKMAFDKTWYNKIEEEGYL